MDNFDNNNFNECTNLETVENSKTSFKDSCKTIWEKMICKDSIIMAVIIFIVLCAINIMFVFDLSLGYWYFVEPITPVLPSIIDLAFYLVGFVFFTVYTIMCCRYNFKKQLLAITSALGLIILGSFITSGLFFPLFNAATLVFNFLINSPEHENTLSDTIPYIANLVFLIAYTCFVFRAYVKKCTTKKYRLSLVKITVILSVIFTGFLVLYGFGFAKYEYKEWLDDEQYTEYSQEYYLSEITSEQRKSYTDIKIGDDASLTEKELTEKGFIKENKNYEDFLFDCVFPYYIDDYLTIKNPEKTIANQYEIYCYSNEMEELDSWDDVISCIIISYDSNCKVNYKLFISNANGINVDGFYLDYEHGELTRSWFDNIEKGENSDKVMNFIRNTGAVIFEDEKYEGDKKINTYKIILQCYYPLEVDFYEFLFNYNADSVNYFYDIEIIAINDKISYKQISEEW